MRGDVKNPQKPGGAQAEVYRYTVACPQEPCLLSIIRQYSTDFCFKKRSRGDPRGPPGLGDDLLEGSRQPLPRGPRMATAGAPVR